MKVLLTTTVLMSTMLFSCGAEDKLTGKQSQITSTATSTLSGGYYTVSGYVSPINISVNGTSYSDSEDFYTQELIKLQAQAEKSYPDHVLTFDANVGLTNFQSGMSVFLVATNAQDVASSAVVNPDGKFSFMLDSNVDKQASYTLRASKRIGLKLVKGSDTIAWCYNMSAEVQTALENTPIILRDFKTVVTQYQCTSQNDNVNVPTPASEVDSKIAATNQAETDRENALATATRAAMSGTSTSTATSTATATATSSATSTVTSTATATN